MPKASVEIRGKKSTWGVDWNASMEQVEAMREDGINVLLIQNSIPLWVAEIGLARPWCFFQDIWNFKNPFRK